MPEHIDGPIIDFNKEDVYRQLLNIADSIALVYKNLPNEYRRAYKMGRELCEVEAAIADIAIKIRYEHPNF